METTTGHLMTQIIQACSTVVPSGKLSLKMTTIPGVHAYRLEVMAKKLQETSRTEMQ